jgi:murein DD-endopeptidase MepM/ murein hydrolase activator NlpD
VTIRPKLIAVLAGAGALLFALVFGAASAAADTCTVTYSLLGSQHSLTVDMPTGATPQQVVLPVGAAYVSGTCTPTSTSSSSSTPTTTSSTTSAPPPSSTTSSGSSTTSGSTSTSPSRTSSSSSSSSSSSTTTSHSSTTPGPTGRGHGQKSSSHPQTQVPASQQQAKPKSKSKSKHSAPKQAHAKKPSRPSNLPSGKGVPSASNPTFSLSLPGPAPIGVPNFFISSFQIPPFLIPIYQAAGIEYQVPWQVLAAINEIETDYGRNLSVSSAGAVGWMQFLPSTWKTWGVDANGDGVADPYNPVDAIFTAARYLHAAGASQNVSQAIFAYNHAGWYVQSVLLRAQLIGGIPSGLVGALTGLVQGHFPVAAPAKYADDNVVSLAKHRVKTPNAAIAIDSNPATRGTSIFAKQGSPVIAVNDGRIVKVGTSPQLGHYIELQDATGNIYTYANLGSVTKQYPVPKPVKVSSKQIIKEFSTPATKAPTSPASAGTQGGKAPLAPASAGTQTSNAPVAPKSKSKVLKVVRAPTPLPTRTQAPSTPAPTQTVSSPLVKERLFANPNRPASYAAGGNLQVRTEQQQISNFQNYFSDTLHLARNQYTLKPLKAGSIVVAGTILGRIGAPSQGMSPHLYFMVQPAGKNAPYIDPKPILDGWKLLEATAVYRADNIDPFFGPGAKNPSIGQVLLMSKQQLTTLVLSDPHVQVYACGRRDIEAGLIDRRVLATIEFLSASGLDPYVSGLECGHSMGGSSGTDAAGSTGASVDISKINGIPILGHQGSGSITDITIRRLLTLQGSMRPDQIISNMSYKDQNNTLALPDHKNRIQITFTPDYGTNKKLAAQIKSILQPGQWIQLINRISQIPEPVVPIAPSKYAIHTPGNR